MIHLRPPPNFTPSFEVVSCFCEYDGTILLLHRQSHKSEGNTWGVPAGKGNPDEDLPQAMSRELYEETGITLTPKSLKFFQTVYVEFKSYSFIYHMFHTSFTSKPKVEIDSKEHKDFIWVTPQEALKMDLIQDLGTCVRGFMDTDRCISPNTYKVNSKLYT